MGRKVIGGHGGKVPRATLNGSEYCFEEMSFEEISEEEDTTNSCGAGKNEYEYGNSHIEGSVRATWDIAANPFQDPPELRSGQSYRMLGYLHSSPGAGNLDGPRYEIDDMRINNVRTNAPVKGKLEVSFNFKSSGAYSYPNQASDSTSGA